MKLLRGEGVAELIIRMLNLCTSYSVSEEILLFHPSYQRLMETSPTSSFQFYKVYSATSIRDVKITNFTLRKVDYVDRDSERHF